MSRGQETPIVPRLETEAVQRLQLDISVIDPKHPSHRSVAGIPQDAFILSLGGERLPPEKAGRVEFDEVCRRPEEQLRERLGPDLSTLIVLVDLNYLDSSMRLKVAAALDSLADQLGTGGVQVKVIAYSRRLVALTHDFTTDPAEIRGTAQELRQETWPSIDGMQSRAIQEAALKDADNVIKQSGIEQALSQLGGISAFTFSDRRGSGSGTLSNLTPLSSEFDLVSRAQDPRPSLAAVESVLLAHKALRGRKALVLFSSGAFDLNENLWMRYTDGPRTAAQGGFTIWAVDARAPGEEQGEGSKLLGYLAASTGGELVEQTGALATIFTRALGALDCYYLFSIPIDSHSAKTQSLAIDVRLDTARYPHLWGMKLRYPERLAIPDPRTRAIQTRLAALMEPEAYPHPEVRLAASYPRGENFLSDIEVGVRLADLDFVREPGRSGLSARFAWEGLVVDAGGATICRIGDGIVRTVRTESPPGRHPPALLVLRGSCALRGAGAYQLRAVVEDLSTHEVGAAVATLIAKRPSAAMLNVSALRLGRNSGNDFLLTLPAPKELEVPRDLKREVWVPLGDDESISRLERLLIRFVICGAEEAPHAIVFRPGAVARAIAQIELHAAGAQASKDRRCREYEGVVPEQTLENGSYGLAIFPSEIGAASQERIDAALAEKRALAAMGFRVGDSPESPKLLPASEGTN